MPAASLFIMPIYGILGGQAGVAVTKVQSWSIMKNLFLGLLWDHTCHTCHIYPFGQRILPNCHNHEGN